MAMIYMLSGKGLASILLSGFGDKYLYTKSAFSNEENILCIYIRSFIQIMPVKYNKKKWKDKWKNGVKIFTGSEYSSHIII